MNRDVLVSVIIIFLNADMFIQEAIDSVFRQTYQNWELILVDDGSSDKSSEIAKRIAQQFPENVVYLEHPNHENRGMSASRNLGIKEAKGPLIAFLDADDVWLPKKVEEQVAILDSYPDIVMLFGKSEYWYSWNGLGDDDPDDYIQEHRIQSNLTIKPPELLIKFIRGRTALPPPSNILVRQKAIKAVGGFEDQFVNLYEDQVLYAKLCIDFPVFVSNHCWIKYRQHSESSASQIKDPAITFKSRLVFLDWLANYLIMRGNQKNDHLVWIALRKELWLFSHFRSQTRLAKSFWLQNLIRFCKKWILRLEENLLPESISNFIWSHSLTSRF